MKCKNGDPGVRKHAKRTHRVSGKKNRRRSIGVDLYSSSKLSNRAKDLAHVVLPEVYPWKVLDSLHKDLSEYLTESQSKALDLVTRQRDLHGYLRLSEEWGLQSIASIDTLPDVRARYLLTSLLKKYQFSTSKAERVKTATDKFFSAEALCKKVNHNGKPLEAFSELDRAAMSYAQDYVKKVIGEKLPDLQVMMDKARHGPGASLDTKEGNTSTFFKYSEFPYSCTADARDLAITMIKNDERWYHLLCTYHSKNQNVLMCNSKKNAVEPITYGMLVNDENPDRFTEEEFWDQFIKIVPGNRIAFVPKSALTERTIAIEPTLNLMLQLGVDGYIRTRLKRFGVDLDSQGWNQELARIGSISGAFSTLDLSAASDTISLWICALLLPPDWFDYLCKLRSPQGVLGDDVVSYEKMSSMGNGFTFALESLIFSALIYGTMKMRLGPVTPKTSDFACYGDDLIVKSVDAPELTVLLYKAGFRLNREKSFTTGDVRESCGMDWFKGSNVRPVTLTGLPQTVRELWCDSNRISRILELRFDIPLGHSKTASCIKNWIPKQYTGYVGPRSNEDFDSYLHVNHHYGEFGVRFSRELFSWRYLRIVNLPLATEVYGAVMFRTLMHDLRPYHHDKYSWMGDRTGKRFEVISRKAMTLAKTKAYTDNWCTPYHEAEPIGFSCNDPTVITEI